ncbi:DUF4190 domain-containing protein [Streptomyces sp. NPDC048272]|uniref:DUF4190 domain-containing protein n=1 Tax=Streptomyces sp. NPDC048272 TaxID=3154616 RepID=UPI003434C422
MTYPPPPNPPTGPADPWAPPSARSPWGPPPPQGPPALNGFALASLLVGLLCLPPLGIVFGVVALVQIARKRERGRSLAVVGLVVSVVMTVVAAYVTQQYAQSFSRHLASSVSAHDDVAGSRSSLDDMGPGDCFNVPGGDLMQQSPFVHAVDCAEVHHAEVTSSILLDDGPFPGDDGLDSTATDACWKAQDSYAMDTWAVPAYAEMYYFVPTRALWRQGDRSLVCVIGTSSEEHRGSLRKDAGMLTREQAEFLRVMNDVDEAFAHQPEDGPEDALPECRTWAREVDSALAVQAALLRRVSGRPGVGAAAGAQLKEVEAARREWQHAARATKPAEFDEVWERAVRSLDVDTEKELRGAYGLSTRVPDWLAEPGDEGPRGPSTGSA